jgi:transposase
MKTIAEIIGGAQALLDINFDLQDCFEEQLTDEYKTFLQLLRVIEEAQPHLERQYAGVGRRPYQYKQFLRSIWAMRHFKIGKTSELIQRLKGDPNLRLLCGFTNVPHKSQFSRNFSTISKMNILNETLEQMVRNAHKDTIVYHVSRDSTAIEARETVKREKPKKEAKKQRGRPKKDEKRTAPPVNRIEKQITQSADEALKELNTACAYGCKKNSSGNIYFWKGYKLHLDISDTGFPLNAIVTGANVHDSQLAIPMEKITGQRVSFCYSLMDAAYDSSAIDNFIRNQGRIPIIDPNKRKSNNRPPLDPAKKERFKFRSGVERANGYLKDNLLPAKIFVKGFEKVSLVLMSAVICLAALRTLQYFIL